MTQASVSHFRGSSMNFYRIPSASIFVVAAIATMLLPTRCPAQVASNPDFPEVNTDVAACPDLKEFPRLPWSIIVSCDKVDSIEVTMPLKPDARGYAREKTIRGVYEFREYHLPPGEEGRAFDSLMQVFPMRGFSIKFASNPSTISGHKEGAWILINLSGEYYDVKLVHVREDPWRPVKDAKEISQEMGAHHRVALYGIRFSSDDQTVVEETSPILPEVLKYFQLNPALAVVVESHKFSANGNAENDQQITSKRAKAVAEWFSTHGIAAARLQIRALGRSKPITDNDTPLEIERNERIELAVAN
jgi:outer membrane protein OmpA-like peptidoglycan-associated protein